MTTRIEIVANGDACGDDEYIPHDKWLAYVAAFARKRYPTANIEISGDPRTDGGCSAYKIDTDADGDEDATEIDLINDAWEAACDDTSIEDVWVPYRA